MRMAPINLKLMFMVKENFFFFKMNCGVHSWFSLCLFTSDRAVNIKKY